MVEEIAWAVGKILFMVVFALVMLVMMIWAERKTAAFVQDRIGPNRASIGGVVRLGGVIHPVADVLKLVFKEDVIPNGVNRFFYILAPFLAMVVALSTYAVLPFGDAIYLSDKIIPLRVANLNVGVLYILAVSSISVYAIVFAGWSSNNKYTFLGGIRSAAQMISYELNMGLAVLSLILVFGTVRIDAMVVEQGELLFGFLPKWGIVVQPVGFFLFLVALFAEVNRTPFDLAEGESELVAGYHLEYSSLRFALFFMAEYVNMIIGAGIVASLFLGGWQIPWMDTTTLRDSGGGLLTASVIGVTCINMLLAALLLRRFERERAWYRDRRKYESLLFGTMFLGLVVAGVLYLVVKQPWNLSAVGAVHFATIAQVGSFLLKTILFAWLFIWVRWTLPRFRYDQLMRVGWKVLLPLGLLNFFVTAVVVLLARN